MIYRKQNMLWFFILALLFFPGVVFGEKFIRSEDKIVSASGISKIRFRDISRSDLIYKGVVGAEQFEIHFKKTVEASNREACEDILSELDLDVTSAGDVTTIRLIHGKSKSGGIFNRIFKKEDWHTVIEITGPQRLDMDAEVKFFRGPYRFRNR